ncbi:MAG: anaerobic ribonucleoside triphosphate reductase [Acholeplasmatales bacterium]|jgi:ribonucleoside-triphosphate reductase|nr:anaerobic ribonucleoside triphosphate reductase [Acholeplasmatales bacterium]
MSINIRKRDGRLVEFKAEKIKSAIKKAMDATGQSDDLIDDITLQTINEIFRKYNNTPPTVEQIQDIVEEELIKNQLVEVAKAYILYRNERNRVRDKDSRLMKTFYDIAFKKSNDSDMKRENANIDSDSPMGAMLKYGSEGAKEFNKIHVLNPVHSNMHEQGDIHIHDLDFLTLTLTCCQIDLTKLFKGGFQTGHGSVREPQDIKTYAALACIAIQSNQNDQHGGQSVAHFDYDMAPGIIKTYYKRYVDSLTKAFQLFDITINAKQTLEVIKETKNVTPSLDNRSIDKYLKTYIPAEYQDKILDFCFESAKKDTTKDAFQAMESLIHNLNTMHSRAGAQVPFSSINYGTDTSPEGRLVIESILNATIAGMGNKETPIFPIQIFKVKDGVSGLPGDPNYDLFQKAIYTSSKRLFPNFSFLDAPFNKIYLKDNNIDTEVAYMGCRTRVIGNTFDPTKEIVTGRGNLSFTSINLPRLAITTSGSLGNKNIDDFFAKLEKIINVVIDQLLERFSIQKKIHVYNFPFLMGQGVWIDSDTLSPSDTIENVIKHGSLSIGFIGLAETLKALTGKHHGESVESQELGLRIIKYIRERCDLASKQYLLNFTCLATPAEGLSGRFVLMDRNRFGVLEGITDHDFYTNSFHVPVYYPISAFKKIDTEAPYHALTNAGHISYIELDGDASKNTEAFKKVIDYMKIKGIGYGSVNHAVDTDPLCGYTGIINNVCPKCGRTESEHAPFARIRRITGYLVGTLDRFNNAKRKEVEERVKHAS